MYSFIKHCLTTDPINFNATFLLSKVDKFNKISDLNILKFSQFLNQLLEYFLLVVLKF